jgi:hypothetical protein
MKQYAAGRGGSGNAQEMRALSRSPFVCGRETIYGGAGSPLAIGYGDGGCISAPM